MTAVTTPRVRKARHSSRCELCNGWISTGQLITYRAGQWVHARCLLPTPPQQATPPGEAGRGATKGTPQW